MHLAAWLVPTGIVALGEMGDGTQLLALPLGDKPARRLSVGLVQGVASAPFALLNPMTWMGIDKLR